MMRDLLIDLCTLPLVCWWRVRYYLAMRRDVFVSRRWLKDQED